MENVEIACALEEVAQRLDEMGASPQQVRAYRAAADTVRRLERPARQILAEEGREGLKSREHITDRMADAIEEMVDRRHLDYLDELRAQAEPEEVFDGIRGIGDALADDIQRELGIVTMEELVAAAADGRLGRVGEIGRARAERIHKALAKRQMRRPALPVAGRPPVAELLAVDEEFRHKARAGLLHRIAPRRYSPTRDPWLPVLGTVHGPRRYSAFPANTHLAHRSGKTGDWVMLYYAEEGRLGQAMVATETVGDLAGKRVVRGREREETAAMADQTTAERRTGG